MQQKMQLQNEKDRETQSIIADLQTQLHVVTAESQKQSADLASTLEVANSNRHDLQVSTLAAKTILDQLQMTNESSRDYGGSLLEVYPSLMHLSTHY